MTTNGWRPYPRPVQTQVGCKVEWGFYADEATARTCAEAARSNAAILAAEGHDWGYQTPGTVTLIADGELAGLWRVTIP
jgi:hypothetical protein